MANNEGVYVFPDAVSKASGIDPGLLALLNNNGGFGNNGYWIWILFMWMIWGGNGNWGNGFGGNNGLLSNQLFNTEGRDLLLQAINGRADALGQLAQITNTSVETVKNGIFSLQNSINQVANQVGMSGLQTINAVQAGDASISSQICQCCCENRLAIANQTSALQAQLAQNDANVRLQLAQLDGSDKLAVCQQTNTLQNQAERDTTSILNAISNQNAMIVKEFCDLKERELQNKINTQGDIITQLRNQISNDEQTLKFNSAFHALDDKIDAIASKQPNTVPVTWPNLTAVNNTPYAGGMYYGNGFGNVVF